ncbi:MAG: CoA-binding protein [Psychroflexus sp.]
MSKKTLVIGASDKPNRYSNLALKSLKKYNFEAVGIGKKEFQIEGFQVYDKQIPLKNIDTVTVYLNPKNQEEYKDYIIKLNPKRVIFNPGAENNDFQHLLENNNIKCLNACTLVLLQTGQY